MTNGPFLYPSVTKVPGQGATDSPRLKDQAVKGEFDQVFDQKLDELQAKGVVDRASDLGRVKTALKFSAHASQRLRDRNIQLEPQTLARVTDAVDRAESKGVQDTLVITKDAALIVNVPNRTIITALDRDQLNGNIFTNIDGAVVV